MSCIEITMLWLSLSVCRPEAKTPRASREHRSARIDPEAEAAVQHLERARERLRAQEDEITEVLRLVGGK